MDTDPVLRRVPVVFVNADGSTTRSYLALSAPDDRPEDNTRDRLERGELDRDPWPHGFYDYPEADR